VRSDTAERDNWTRSGTRDLTRGEEAERLSAGRAACRKYRAQDARVANRASAHGGLAAVRRNSNKRRITALSWR
jgi:hypothetical protein